VSRPTAAILLTGSELLRGVISDRNASHLAERLEALGFEMRRTLMVGDPLADIEQAVRDLSGAHDLIVTSGGLGPTHDDRTVEALANVAGVPLVLNEEVLGQVTAWTDGVAERMGFDRERFTAGNRKQARIPQGADVLGLAGTAPGLVMDVEGSVVVVLPGVPSELRRLWELAPVHPRLQGLMGRTEPRERRLLRTYGIGESHVADLFAEAGGDPPGVETSICARNYEIEIDIRAAAGATADGDRLWRAMQEALGSHVFATDERPVAELVLDAARARGVTLATAESCTGGMVAAELTAVPGSSDVFLGGAVTYSNQLKHDVVGVPDDLVERYGAVSAEVAAAMADGARDRLGSDVAVGVTGIAGPGGGSEHKPVGLVHVHVSGLGRDTPLQMQWGGRRADIRLRATVASLHALLDHLASES
jgi:competence/damage-inducible protein CinA-like protein